MQRSLLVILAVIAGAMALATEPAMAQDVPLKVAICNPLKVVTQLTEYKDMVKQVNDEKAALNVEMQNRTNKISAMQDELKLLMVDSPQYAQKNEDLLEYTIQTDSYAKIHDLDETRKQKQRTKLLFDRIFKMIAQIAQDKKITLVLSDQQADIPDNLDSIDVSTLNSMLMQRTILYNDPHLDLTQDVVTALNAAYAGANAH